MESYVYKICLFGPGGVGKTTLTRKYLTGLFEDDTKFTMGASIHVKIITIDDKRITLQIWDFGGENQFRFLLPVYSHGSACGIFMSDLSRYSTIKDIEEWIRLFQEGLEEGEKDIPLLLVGGKLDLIDKRAISEEEARKFAEKNNCFDYIECSSKTGENIEKVFEIAVNMILKRFFS